MLVKELIQELKKFKPSEEIVFHCDIETGRSFSYCKEGDLSVSVEELDEDEIKDMYIKECMGDEEHWTYEEFINDDYDNEKNIKKFVKNYKPRVIVSISGEETDYE